MSDLLQPILQNHLLILQPLMASDFDGMYLVAKDPKIWEQHPNPNRYKKEVFATYFEGALSSKSAFTIINKDTDEIMGSTRFYDYSKEEKTIFIGYTFLACKYWGGQYNPLIKKLLLEYIFEHVDSVLFHVGASNKRSQLAMQKLGAKENKRLDVAYYGEKDTINIEYIITKENWISQQYS
jgi:N-acetyltransferase